MSNFLRLVPVILVVIVSGGYVFSQNESEVLPLMTVYKTPTCGCCKKWVEHIEANGFKVHIVENTNLSSLKNEKNIPPDLRSCHTATVGKYTIEGHVPAQDIVKLLKEKSDIQ